MIFNKINNAALILATLIFLYFFIFFPNSMSSIYGAYLLIFVVINLILMSIIYLFFKTGSSYFYREWVKLLVIIVLLGVYSIIKRYYLK
jgi:hypothetical protein